MDGVAPPVSPAELAQFQRGAQIRDLFFGAGGANSRRCASTSRRTLDTDAKQVTLDLGGTAIVYAHGPQPRDVGDLAGPEPA